MAQPVTKWQGANGSLHDTEAEADQSLADDKVLRELAYWIGLTADIHDNTSPEEIAIAVLRGFNVTRRGQ